MVVEIVCPVCKKSFHLESDLEVGDTLHCVKCETCLEIFNIDPINIKVSTDKTE